MCVCVCVCAREGKGVESLSRPGGLLNRERHHPTESLYCPALVESMGRTQRQNQKEIEAKSGRKKEREGKKEGSRN